MNEGSETQRDHIISNLEALNKQVGRQMSVLYIFRNGIIYGFGFVLGSTVLTAIIVSTILTFFGDTIFAKVIFWFAGVIR